MTRAAKKGFIKQVVMCVPRLLMTSSATLAESKFLPLTRLINMRLTAIVLIVILSGCASVGPSKNWTADRFDQRTRTLLAQIGLRSEGFNDVPVNGKIDRRTRSAALSFRKSRGLPQSNNIDGTLVESIYKEHDLSKSMPYVEGFFRSCFRWGPDSVLIMASNAGTLTCHVKGAGRPPTAEEINSAKQFCVKSVPIQSGHVKCGLIFNGQRIVGERRLAKMLANPSPDIPVIIEVSDSARGIHTSMPAVLRSNDSRYYFTKMSAARPAEETFRFSLVAGSRNKEFCSGTARYKGPLRLIYTGKCSMEGDVERFEGEATLVGMTPKRGQLVPAFETRIVQQNSQVKIRPPDNVIRF